MPVRRLLGLILVLPLAACATGTPTPSSSPTATAAATSTPAVTSSTDPSGAPARLTLRRAPDDLGCDAIGVDYRSVTFRIDPTAAEQVSAIADTGKILRTYWASAFQPGTVSERVIRDPSGQVVAIDGELLAIPEGAWPRLHGYFVCPSPEAIYVLLTDPA